ncbi:MAG: hypothetical protein ACPL25_10285 [Ignavibacteria bacterium]
MVNLNLVAAYLVFNFLMGLYSFNQVLSSLVEVLKIGDKKNQILLQVTSVAYSDKNYLYVIDSYAYKVKMFNDKGELLKEAGRRGKERGCFSRQPNLIAYYKNRLAITEFVSSKVHIFSEQLEWLYTFTTAGIIFSISFDSNGNLWVGLIDGEGKTSLVEYNLQGKQGKKIKPKNNLGKDFEFEDLFSVSITKSGLIVIAHSSLNKIELWNTTGKFISDFGISDLPLHTEKILVDQTLFSRKYIPSGVIFADIAIDNDENLYLLSGNYSKNPFRDLYVVNKDGESLRKLIFPEEMSKVYFTDKSELIAIQKRGTQIKLYRIK